MAEQAKYTMELDENLQIIRNHVYCTLDESLARQLTDTVAAIIPRLKNPEKVRFLVYFNLLDKGTPKGHRIFMNNVKRAGFYKMAILGNNPYIRALAAFILVATGIDKVKLFSNEPEALAWLNK